MGPKREPDEPMTVPIILLSGVPCRRTQAAEVTLAELQSRSCPVSMRMTTKKTCGPKAEAPGS